MKLTDKKAKTTNKNMNPKQAKNCTAMNHAWQRSRVRVDRRAWRKWMNDTYMALTSLWTESYRATRTKNTRCKAFGCRLSSACNDKSTLPISRCFWTRCQWMGKTVTSRAMQTLWSITSHLSTWVCCRKKIFSKILPGQFSCDFSFFANDREKNCF